MSSTTSPKTSLAKLGLYPKAKPFKVMVLGQAGVGKSEYDPNLEQIYPFPTNIDNEMVYFEILDSAGEPRENECSNMESNIRWADAFILMYSVNDKCSFEECHRLKFLINYTKSRRRRLTKDNALETPVVLVGNKIDQMGDRMVSTEEGRRRSKEIGCVCFHEVSVRESIEQVLGVFRDVRRFYRVSSKWGKKMEPAPATLERPLVRSASDSATEDDDSTPAFCSWTELELEEEDEASDVIHSDSTSSFRARASTDSRLPPRPSRLRHPSSTQPMPARRMSVSMRGSNAGNF